MLHFITDVTKPIKIDGIEGEVKLLETVVWKGWESSKFDHLFTYKRGGKRYMVPVESGKTYTMRDIQLAVLHHINADEQVALLYHNNSRVTWKLYDNVKTTEVFLSDGLMKQLNIENAKNLETGEVKGSPINKEDITFTFFFPTKICINCLEIEPTRLNNRDSRSLHILPGVKDSTLAASWNDNYPAVKFRNNYVKELNFEITDENGVKLPIKHFLLALQIKYE